MYDKEAINDSLKEFLICGAEFEGLGFPILQRSTYIPKEVIPFSEITKEKRPREKCCHFFIDDYRFNRIWNNPTAYTEQLSYLDGIITPDFSMTAEMPVVMQMWNCYRNRALAYWMQQQGNKIIPTVGWTDEKSYKWCFDGIPKGSNVAVSTNGCHNRLGMASYRAGMIAMVEILKPNKIIVVGKPIEVPEIDTEQIYFKSHGQLIAEMITGGKHSEQ